MFFPEKKIMKVQIENSENKICIESIKVFCTLKYLTYKALWLKCVNTKI